MAERNLRPKELAERKNVKIYLKLCYITLLNLHVVEIDNVIKGVVPAIPVSNRTASNVALTVDRVSAFKNHWIPINEVAGAADIITQLQDTPKVVSMLESLKI